MYQITEYMQMTRCDKTEDWVGYNDYEQSKIDDSRIKKPKVNYKARCQFLEMEIKVQRRVINEVIRLMDLGAETGTEVVEIGELYEVVKHFVDEG